MRDEGSVQVKRRRVFYIPGYDPIHPRRYRELYRKESAEQAAISGYHIAISPKQASDTFGWRVQAEISGASVETDVEVLVWSDLVRASMATSVLATYIQLLRTAWVYLSTGTFWRLMRLRKGPVIAALYPVVALLLQLMIAVLAAVAVVWTGPFILGPELIGTVLAIGLAVTVFVLVLVQFKKHDGRVFAHYLMHDYAFAAQARGANPPELDARIAVFATKIRAALGENLDEVLVIGHSSGVQLGISALAKTLREHGNGPIRPALGFLSLGQVVPMVSFLPEAHDLRADLHFLASSDAVTWIDVSAPGDGCAFALCDPVSVSGVMVENKRGPLVFSAAFTQTLGAERRKAMRWRFFRLHFQYLCAFDRPKDYDYFQITAGPKTLAGRYAGRAPSPSRIEQAASRYSYQPA